MANIIGKNKLTNKINEISQTNFMENSAKYELKGLSGELAVAEALEKLLPKDTTIIIHPQIGITEPDILVVSPRYGFRIIEVKTWNIGSVNYADKSWNYECMDKTIRLMQQLKFHAEELNKFLGNILNRDTYKQVGFMIIQYGFTEEEFIEKFCQKWSKDDINEYKEFCLFSNDMNKNIDNNLKNAIKYHPPLTFSTEILNHCIEKITETTQVTQIINISQSRPTIDIDEMLNRHSNGEWTKATKNFDAAKKKINFNQNVKQTENKRKKTNKIIIAIVLLVIVAGAISIFLLSNKTTNEQNKQPQQQEQTQEIEQVTENINAVAYDSASNQAYYSFTEAENKQVIITGTVENFYYNGYKLFTIIIDQQNKIKGYIPANTQNIPYLEDGAKYKFKGKIETYEGELEIVINEVYELN